MTKDQIIALVRQAAEKHNLPAGVLLGMAERESNFDTFAIRYEPGFLLRYVMPEYRAGKLDVSETYARAFSWGIFQCMGQTARELGFEGKYLTELCDPPVGIEFGCRKLADCLKRAGGNIDKALEMFNGGSNANYPGEVMMLAIPYRVTPPVTKA